jgi:hypothetical protein
MAGVSEALQGFFCGFPRRINISFACALTLFICAGVMIRSSAKAASRVLLSDVPAVLGICKKKTKSFFWYLLG